MIKRRRSCYITLDIKFFLGVLYLLWGSEDLEVIFPSGFETIEVIRIISPDWHIYIWRSQVRVICENCRRLFETSFTDLADVQESLEFVGEHSLCEH